MNVMYDAIHQRKQVLYTRSHTTGFTIVELLIVIVIIAILAAITIVAYSGIQQRAQNSAIISAAEQTYKLIEGYVSTNDAYPLTFPTGGDVCITTSSGCADSTGTAIASSTALITALKTIGSPPTSIPTVGTRWTGIRYDYAPARTIDGKVQPVVILYALPGKNQQCKLSGIVTSTFPAGVTSSTGYTDIDLTSSMTTCEVTVPGPSA